MVLCLSHFSNLKNVTIIFEFNWVARLLPVILFMEESLEHRRDMPRVLFNWMEILPVVTYHLHLPTPQWKRTLTQVT